MSTADRHSPFITPESPSYERAGREFRHPTVNQEAELIAAISQLCEAEQNAADAFRKAAEQVQGAALATELHTGAKLHETRRALLDDLVTALGGSPPTPEECRDLLAHGAAAVSRCGTGEAANDAIVETLSLMRDELAAIYAQTHDNPNLDDTQRKALEQLKP